MLKRPQEDLPTPELVPGALIMNPAPPAAPQAEPAPAPAAAPGLSILPKGARLEGKLRAACSLQIEGEFEGSIVTDGDMVLAPGSHVEAEIHARNVIVGGHHRG